MNRVKCNINKQEHKVTWSIESKTYDNLFELLQSQETELSEDSSIVVVLCSSVEENSWKSYNEVAKLRYKVSYDMETNILSIIGLKGKFEDNPYNALIRFKNVHLGVGIEHQCTVSYYFKLYVNGGYESESECSDSDSD